MRIAILCAMPEEAALISGVFKEVTTVRMAGVSFTRGTVSGHQAVLCLSGIGKANAAATTQLVLSVFAPDVIVNIGLAGNCTPTLPLGGAVVAERLVYHDLNVRLAAPVIEDIRPDGYLVEAAVQTLTALDIPFLAGTVATGDQFVTASALRDDIVARTGAACIEMEGAAVAHIAAKNDVPFVTVKLMSDNADDGAGDDFNACLAMDAYCARSAAIVAGLLERID